VAWQEVSTGCKVREKNGGARRVAGDHLNAVFVRLRVFQLTQRHLAHGSDLIGTAMPHKHGLATPLEGDVFAYTKQAWPAHGTMLSGGDDRSVSAKRSRRDLGRPWDDRENEQYKIE